MNRALPFVVIVLEELALVLATFVLIAVLVVWIVSDAIERLHYATFYRFFAKRWKGEQ